MFSLHDDDEGDFAPVLSGQSNSKLASLFGMDQASYQSGNSSLTYVAPKQPKQNDSTAAESKIAENKSQVSALLHATAVHTFRLVNGQYVGQGKLGLAVLGNHAEKDYKLLLYVSQKKPVASSKITPSFSFMTQKNNYASFYDDQAQMWSISFDNEKAFIDFCKWVSIAKLKSNGASPQLVSIDIVEGEGQALQSGDLLETQYTGWLITNSTIGKVFDSNVETGKTFKVKLGRGKVIKGWDEGIVGMKKGGRRILAIPSSMAYGLKGVSNQIPPSAELLFMIEVKRAKFANPSPAESAEKSSKTDNASKQNEDSTKPSVLDTPASQLPKLGNVEVGANQSVATPSSSPDELDRRPRSESTGSVKQLSQSISEKTIKTTEGTSDKSHLLARMSRMGQAMIPEKSSPAGSQEDDDVEVSRERTNSTENLTRSVSHSSSGRGSPSRPALQPKPEHIHRNPPERPHSRSSSVNEATHDSTHQSNSSARQFEAPHPHAREAGPVATQQPVALYQPPMNNMYAGMHNQMYGGIPSMANQMPSAELNLMATENRMNASETRSAVLKVNDKMDDVMRKMNEMELLLRSGNSHHRLGDGSSAMDMEASALAQNIVKIVKENETLKSECTEKTTKIENLNEKISDLLQRNQKYLEKSNIFMEQHADSIQSKSTQSSEKLTSLQETNAQLSTQLGSLDVRLKTYQSQLQIVQQEKEELQIQTLQLKNTNDRLKHQLTSSDVNSTEEQAELEQLRRSIKEFKKERKQGQLQRDHLEEEVHDLKQEKQALQKSLDDRKKKHISDKETANQELDEMRQMHESELSSLKTKLLTGNETEKILKLEEDLNANWQRKLDVEILTWQEKVKELENSKSELTSKIDGLETQLSIESSKEIDNAAEDTEKVDLLEKDKIKLTEERDHLQIQVEMQLTDFEKEKLSLTEQSYTKGFEAGQATSPASTSDIKSGDDQSVKFAGQVKSIMNRVFTTVRSEFDSDESYSGSEVTSSMLEIIKEITLQAVQALTNKPDSQQHSNADNDTEEEVDN